MKRLNLQKNYIFRGRIQNSLRRMLQVLIVRKAVKNTCPTEQTDADGCQVGKERRMTAIKLTEP